MHIKKATIFILAIIIITITFIAIINPNFINNLKLKKRQDKAIGPKIETPLGTLILAPIETPTPECISKPTFLTPSGYTTDEDINKITTLITYYTNGDKTTEITKYYKRKLKDCGYTFILSNNESPTGDLTSLKYLYFDKTNGNQINKVEIAIATAEKDNKIYSIVQLRMNQYTANDTSSKEKDLDFEKASNIRPKLIISQKYYKFLLNTLSELFEASKLYNEDGTDSNAQLIFVIKNTPTKTDLSKLRLTLEKKGLTIKYAKITPCKLLSVHATDKSNHLIINPAIGKHAVYVYLFKE